MTRDLAEWQRGRRRRERRRRQRVFAILFVAAVVIGLGAGTSQTVLKVKAVTVASPDDALAAEVSGRVSLPVGTNVMTTDLSELVEQAEAVPKVGRVVVDRKLPDRLVLIVYPRVPVMAFERGEECLLVDAEGVCIEWAAEPPEGVLSIVGTPGDAEMEEVGARRTDEWFERGLDVAQALAEEEDLGPWTMQCANPSELTLISGSKARGIIGVDGDCDKQARLFAELLRELEGRGERVGRMELRTREPVWWER